jgi:hypothetical protein
MRSLGVLALIVGALVAGYALFVFDPTVAGYGGDRINNIGRLSDRQNLLIAGSVIAIIGALLAVFGGSTPKDETPEGQFREALRIGDLKAMEDMLQTGQISASGGTSGGKGWLQIAAAHAALDQARLLLKFGADPSARDSMGQTALEVAGNAHAKPLVREFKAWVPRDPAEVAALIKAAPANSPATSGPPIDVASQLTQLAALRDSGALTPTEFQAAKTRLLGAPETT